MKDFFYWINPLNWIKSALGIVLTIAAALALSLWLWHMFTSWIIGSAVEDNNQHWVVQFNQQARALNVLGQEFIDQGAAFKKRMDDITADSRQKLQKEQDRADKATKDYKRELQAKKQLAAERDSLVAALDERRTKRLPELTRPISAGTGGDRDSAETGRLREFADGLGRLLAQCQQTAADLRRTAATAIDRVGAAEATSRALKPD